MKSQYRILKSSTCSSSSMSTSTSTSTPITPSSALNLSQNRKRTPSNVVQPVEIIQFEESEAKLEKLELNDCKDIVKYWDIINCERENLERISKTILSTDIKLFSRSCIDQRTWKSSFYNYISILRYDLKDPKKNKYEDQLFHFINCGIKFFNKLLNIIEEMYGINFKSFKAKNDFQPQTSFDKTDKNYYVYPTLYRIFIFLGDLKRYSLSTKVRNDVNLRLAIEFYDTARWTDPRKGRAFYQLGFVNKLKGDDISALYNFWRAYLSRSPIEGSRSELLTSYDDAAKKYKKDEANAWHVLSRIPPPENRSRLIRREIWNEFFFKGVNTELPPTIPLAQTREEYFSKYDTSSICQKFSYSFNLFILKIFSRIDVDTIEFVAEDTLVYLERLVEKTNIMKVSHIVQIVHVSTCIIEYLKRLKIDERDLQQKYIQQVLRDFTLEMFGVFICKLERMVHLCDWDNPVFELLASGLHVWTSWLQLNKDYLEVWVKPRKMCIFGPKRIERRRNINYDDKRKEDDVWLTFAQLMTRLEVIFQRCSKYIFPKVGIKQSDSHKYPVGILPEYLMLEGTKMVDEISQFRFFTNSSFKSNQKKSRIRNYIRLYSIYKFGSMVLSSDKNNKFQTIERNKGPNESIHKYRCLVKYLATNNLPGLDSRNYKFWTMEVENTSPPVPVIRRPDSNNARVILKKIKVEKDLTIPPKRPRMRPYEIWNIVSDRRFPTEIIIDPKRIVIDTNCLLRNLPDLYHLMTIILIPIYIPLTVVIELKGIRKGGLGKKFIAIHGPSTTTVEAREMIIQNEILAGAAKRALAFIDKHLQYFKIISFSGKEIKVRNVSYSRINDDYFDSNLRNDDRIFETTKYLETRDFEARRKDTPRRIFRHTILLTADRGLRVKATSLDIKGASLQTLLALIYKRRFRRQRKNRNRNKNIYHNSSYPNKFYKKGTATNQRNSW